MSLRSEAVLAWATAAIYALLGWTLWKSEPDPEPERAE